MQKNTKKIKTSINLDKTRNLTKNWITIRAEKVVKKLVQTIPKLLTFGVFLWTRFGFSTSIRLETPLALVSSPSLSVCEPLPSLLSSDSSSESVSESPLLCLQFFSLSFLSFSAFRSSGFVKCRLWPLCPRPRPSNSLIQSVD
jgi:hypothetical protein